MSTFQGHRCSDSWKVVLDAAWADGVRFTANSLQRTMAEQAELVRTLRPRGVLVADPSPTAPHIRVGREDHALDINADGGQTRLANWLRRNGVPCGFPISSEPWHLEVDREADLIALANRLCAPSLDVLTVGERKAVDSYLWHLRRARKSKRLAAKNLHVRVLRKGQIRAQARAIEMAAKRDGWRKLNRESRHKALTTVLRTPGRYL